MSVTLEQRVEALERAVSHLAKAAESRPTSAAWWRTDAGRFADDPVFDEIVRLGRAYRESLTSDEPGRNGT